MIFMTPSFNREQKTTVLIIPHYKLLTFIALASILSWVGFGMVLFGNIAPVTTFNPWDLNNLGILLFFLSLGFALTGTFGLILFFIKKWRMKNEVYLKHISISIRQGALMSLTILLALGLEILGLLRIWNGLLLVLLMLLIEFYLSGKDEV